MQLQIVTPKGAKVDTDAATMVTAPGTIGELGILPGHRPLLTSLGIGKLEYSTGSGEPQRLAINGGYLEVADDKVIVITETAETPEEIDVERARAALKRATAKLAELSNDPSKKSEIALATKSQKRAENRIAVGRFVKRAIPD